MWSGPCTEKLCWPSHGLVPPLASMWSGHFTTKPLLNLSQPDSTLSVYVIWFLHCNTPAELLVALFCPQRVCDLIPSKQNALLTIGSWCCSAAACMWPLPFIAKFLLNLIVASLSPQWACDFIPLLLDCLLIDVAHFPLTRLCVIFCRLAYHLCCWLVYTFTYFQRVCFFAGTCKITCWPFIEHLSPSDSMWTYYITAKQQHTNPQIHP